MPTTKTANSSLNPRPARFCLSGICKTSTGQFVLLGIILYVFVVLFWSFYTLGTLTVHVQNNNKEHNSVSKLRSSFRNESYGIRDLKFGDVKPRHLTCVGWKSTRGCSPNGPRDSSRDQNCTQMIPRGESGYCEVKDVDSGEYFRVMRRHCNVMKKNVRFRCRDAPQFVNFRVKADKFAKSVLKANFHLPHTNASQAIARDGIVMVVYPKLVASAYATIRVLRHTLHCMLPIELWYRPDEMVNRTILEPMRHLARSENNVTLQRIQDPLARRFAAKIHAIYHSTFDRVLFLDADNVPVRDPTFLFESREFGQTGAIFWPDFWHPEYTIFGVNDHSLVWELLDMSFVDMFEQESGQVLVDRRRHAAPLALVRFYALNRPNFFSILNLVWGDKDLFRLAWLKLEIPFTMIKTPPSMAGIVQDSVLQSTFCGMTMVQHDEDGNILFLHRNQQKLTGKSTDTRGGDPLIWTHLVRFREKSKRRDYQIRRSQLDLDFQADQRCFGPLDVYRNPNFYIQEIHSLNFSGLESQLRRFAVESTHFSLHPESN